MGRSFLLQGIFPIQGSNPHLSHLLPWQVGFFTTEPPQGPRSIMCYQIRLKESSRGRIKIRRKQSLMGFLYFVLSYNKCHGNFLTLSPRRMVFLELYLRNPISIKRSLVIMWVFPRLLFFVGLFLHSLTFGHCTASRIVVLWPGIEPGPMAVKAPSPLHCTTKEFPPRLLKEYSCILLVKTCCKAFPSCWLSSYLPSGQFVF